MREPVRMRCRNGTGDERWSGTESLRVAVVTLVVAALGATLAACGDGGATAAAGSSTPIGSPLPTEAQAAAKAVPVSRQDRAAAAGFLGLGAARLLVNRQGVVVYRGVGATADLGECTFVRLKGAHPSITCGGTPAGRQAYLRRHGAMYTVIGDRRGRGHGIVEVAPDATRMAIDGAPLKIVDGCATFTTPPGARGILTVTRASAATRGIRLAVPHGVRSPGSARC